MKNQKTETTKRNTLTNPQVIQLHAYLVDNAEDLKGKPLFDVAAIAVQNLSFSIKTSNVRKMENDFNLGLGARKQQKKGTTLADIETLRAKLDEYKKNTDKKVFVLAGEVGKLYTELSQPFSERLRGILKSL